ncbi:MAG: hypothetical protein ABIB71_00280 [Candidatus Woesearchaeota archaeon]
MDTKTNVFMIMVVVAFLAISGCQQQSSAVSGPYKYEGDMAVVASFVLDAPVSLETDPYSQNEEIDVDVEIVNKLPEDLPAGKVKVRLNADAAISTFFTGAKEMSSPLLSGIDSETGEETPEEVSLGPVKYVADLPTKASKEITGQYCYSYPVKVKGFLYYTDRTDEIGQNLPAGSNPPSAVQVTDIEQRAVDIQSDDSAVLKFKVTVANLGDGVVIGAMDDCFKYRKKTEREVLKLTASGGYPISCDNDGEVRLSRDTGRKVVNCEVSGIDARNLGNQPSELSLTLGTFAYQQDLDPVTIWLEP